MHGTPTSACETPAIYTVCAYQTLRAVFFIFAVCVFLHYKHVCACIYMSASLFLCVYSICARVYLLCVHVYVPDYLEISGSGSTQLE